MKRSINYKTVFVGIMFGLLFISLMLLSLAIQNSQQFSIFFTPLFLVNLAAVFSLIVILSLRIYQLGLAYVREKAGSRLTVKLTLMFALIALVPGSVVYYFSFDFLRQGIDSWFDARTESALSDALELGRSSQDYRMRDLRKKTESVANEIRFSASQPLILLLSDMRERIDASELTLLNDAGRVLATSSPMDSTIVPDLPNESLLLHVRQVKSYVGLDAIRNKGLHMRVLVYIDNPIGRDGMILQGLYPVPARPNELATNIQSAYVRYRELAFVRPHLKTSLIVTLSLVLLLSLLGAFWVAIYAARLLVAPISRLAQGTEAIAAGDYEQRIPTTGNDELGFLVQSFNEMSKRLSKARDDAKIHQQLVEDQRAYLEAVLGRLSSGVITLNSELALRTSNDAASQILGIDMHSLTGLDLHHAKRLYPSLDELFQLMLAHIEDGAAEWSRQIEIMTASGRQVLMCRGSTLPHVNADPIGYVVVFDDITTLLQAQREAAWGEVARRLAHEIKNPLTPIQLSAERLRHKFLEQMNAEDGEMLKRLTHTIVQQVETMKEMVKAFSEYAVAPRLKLQTLDINQLLREVLDLYDHHEGGFRIETRLQPDLPLIRADQGRMRQLLHNVIKNAQESIEQKGNRIAVTSRTTHNAEAVEIVIEDNGAGIPNDIMDRLFEPYVTTKPKGSGLGLAIVKKIVDEHKGMIQAINTEHGARITISLPGMEIQTKEQAV